MNRRQFLSKGRKPGSQNGFTLLEMAIVIIISGIIMSAVLTVLPSVMRTGKLKEGRVILDKYDRALQGYAIVNLRLPYADTSGNGEENNGEFVGDLPYRTLGLSSRNDAWGNPVKYAVYGSAGNPSISLTGNPADKAALLVIIGNIPPAATSFNSAYAYTTSSGACGGSDSTNQAYVIASGGPKDLDGINDQFDGCNGAAGMGFNAANWIQDTNYDDIVRSLSISEFSAITCSP